MTPIRQMERRLFPCPEVDTGEYPADPMLMDENSEVWSSAKSDDDWIRYAYPVVREKEEKRYLDLYFYDPVTKDVSRFVIAPGLRMEAEEEERFLELLHQNTIYFLKNLSENLERLQRSFPEWHLSEDELTHIVLEHAYFASHRSGAREILYKAGLFNYARIIESIPCYNLIGTRPEAIIDCGLPLRLLRVLGRYGANKFYTQESIERCKEVYKKYSGYFGKNISNGQWQYLEELLPGGIFEGEKFNRTLFNRMLDYDTCVKQILHGYKEYLNWREQFPFLKKRKLPDWHEVLRLNRLLNGIDGNLGKNEGLNRLIQNRKREGGYEYQNDWYSIIMPADVFAFHVESAGQENCVLDYMEKHADGDTTILFLRKNEKPIFPYVTVRVEQNKVVEAKATFNIEVSDEVAEFLEEYEQWLQTKKKEAPNDLHNFRSARLSGGQAEAAS